MTELNVYVLLLTAVSYRFLTHPFWYYCCSSRCLGEYDTYIPPYSSAVKVQHTETRIIVVVCLDIKKMLRLLSGTCTFRIYTHTYTVLLRIGEGRETFLCPESR